LGRPALERYLAAVAPQWLREEGASRLTLTILNLLRILDAINALWSGLLSGTTVRLPPPASLRSLLLLCIKDLLSYPSFQVRAGSVTGPNHRINLNEFINPKLTAKLTRQLQDVITVCSCAFPRWCNELATGIDSALFVVVLLPCLTACSQKQNQTQHRVCIPVPVRDQAALSQLHLVRDCACHQGPQDQRARTAPTDASPQPQQGNGVGGRQEMQHFCCLLIFVRPLVLSLCLQVAISRQQILQAAQKVMELYAHHKAVLEVGYFNEVGVGAVCAALSCLSSPPRSFFTLLFLFSRFLSLGCLVGCTGGKGPTLEFYTMVSHELQKRKHGLWLDQAPSLMEVDTLDGKNAANAADEGEQYVFHPAGLFPSLLRSLFSVLLPFLLDVDLAMALAAPTLSEKRATRRCSISWADLWAKPSWTDGSSISLSRTPSSRHNAPALLIFPPLS